MKVVFDFDDVLLDTKSIKAKIFEVIAKNGGSKEEIEEAYLKEREKDTPFSLKAFLSTYDEEKAEDLYKEILSQVPSLVNKSVLDIVKDLGKDNCIIATNGEAEYQRDKIMASEVEGLFDEIHITSGSKKEIIESICMHYKDEPVIFVDDKQIFFDDIDMTRCPNLHTVLFDEGGLEKLKGEIRGVGQE